MRASLLLFFVASVTLACAQTPNERLRAELERIHELDQEGRKHIGEFASGTAQRDSIVRSIAHQDSLNVKRVTAIIDSAGWLGTDQIGEKANSALWLVIQHADLATQDEYISEMQLAVDEGKAGAADLAYLKDRVEMRHGREQIYGSQISMVNGKSTLWAIVDEAHVNERRKSVGLGPLENYAAQFGINWSPPPPKERVLLMEPAK